MPELPDDPIAELESLIAKHGVQDGVEGDDLPVIDVVSDLPANRSLEDGELGHTR